MVIVKKRRARKPAVVIPGKTAWITRDASGTVVKENPYGPGSALIVTQRLAELAGAEVELTIERRDLFGPPAPLYRVVRDEDGTVTTFTISEED